MDTYEEMIAVIRRLDEAAIPYALCGGLALMIYGYPSQSGELRVEVERLRG